MQQVEVPISKLGTKQSKDRDIQSQSLPNKFARKVGLTTMGCKVNTYESALISESFKSDNWQVVSASEFAEMYIINTCTVTQEADRQARREVRKVIKINPEAIIVVTGCYAQMDAEACAEIPGVDLVVGNDKKLDIHQLLPKLEAGELPKVLVGDLNEHVSLPEHILTSYENHTRAFIQIQQGCNQGCTFCIIHIARGPSRSLAPTLIRRQVERLALNDYPEVVICGVDLGSYGEDFSESLKTQHFDLVKLIKMLLELDIETNPNFRIRLSSIDPAHITDELIDLMEKEPRMCPHLHLSLQSGSTLILKRMKRRYDREYVYERIQKLRKKVPELVLSADVMVGFPTETEENYLETEQAIVDLDIAFPHVFAYSERDGTPAARIPTQKTVAKVERKQRSARLRETALQLQKTLLQSRLGKTAWVLPETNKNGVIKGRSEDYLNVRIMQKDEETIKIGQWVKVVYQSLDQQFLNAIVN